MSGHGLTFFQSETTIAVQACMEDTCMDFPDVDPFTECCQGLAAYDIAGETCSLRFITPEGHSIMHRYTRGDSASPTS